MSDERQGFRPPTCVCSHPSGSHARGSVSLNPAHPAGSDGGICFLCDCDGFRDDRDHDTGDSTSREAT